MTTTAPATLATAAPRDLVSIRRSADRWRACHDAVRTLFAIVSANAYLDAGRRGVSLDAAVDLEQQLTELAALLDREGTALTVEMMQLHIKTTAPHPGRYDERPTTMQHAKARDEALGLPTDLVVPVPATLRTFDALVDRIAQRARPGGSWKYKDVPAAWFEELFAHPEATSVRRVALALDICRRSARNLAQRYMR